MICTEPAGGPEVAPRPTTSLLCTPDGYSGYSPYGLIPFFIQPCLFIFKNITCILTYFVCLCLTTITIAYDENLAKIQLRRKCSSNN